MTTPERTYFIRAADGRTQGPFSESKIRAYVAQGRVRVDMEFSPDGEYWFTGQSWPDMFPWPERPPTPVPRDAAPASAQPVAPPGVTPPPLPVHAPDRDSVPPLPRAAASRRGGVTRERTSPLLVYVLLLTLGLTAVLAWRVIGRPGEVDERVAQAVRDMGVANKIMESPGALTDDDVRRLVTSVRAVRSVFPDLARIEAELAPMDLKPDHVARIRAIAAQFRENVTRHLPELRRAGYDPFDE